MGKKVQFLPLEGVQTNKANLHQLKALKFLCSFFLLTFCMIFTYQSRMSMRIMSPLCAVVFTQIDCLTIIFMNSSHPQSIWKRGNGGNLSCNEETMYIGLNAYMLADKAISKENLNSGKVAQIILLILYMDYRKSMLYILHNE